MEGNQDPRDIRLGLLRDPSSLYYERGNLLPLKKNKLTGQVGFASPGFVDDIVAAIRAPLRAMRGELDVNSPEGMVQALNLAGLAAGADIGRTAVPAVGRAIAEAQPRPTIPGGSFRSQRGAVGPLERVDPQRGMLAERMRASVEPVYDPRQVEIATRSLELPSGQLVTATDPGRGFNAQALKQLEQTGKLRGSAGGLMDMPTFFRLAPEAKDVRLDLEMVPGQAATASWDFGKGLISGQGRSAATGPNSVEGVTTHELAHVGQDIFGFPRGGNAPDMQRQMRALAAQLQKQKEAARPGSKQYADLTRAQENLDSWFALDDQLAKGPGFGPYLHLQGEALARAVQNLHKLPPQERAAAALQYDVLRRGLLTRPEDVVRVAAPLSPEQ